MQQHDSDPRSRIKKGNTDRAVSPVIGVILMVAITVILAAVIGVMVFGLADDLGDSPTQATLSFDSNHSDYITVTHDGGDTLDFDDGDYALVVNGSTVYSSITEAADGETSLSSGETIAFNKDDQMDGATFDANDSDVDVSIRDNNADSTVDSGTVTIGEDQ